MHDIQKANVHRNLQANPAASGRGCIALCLPCERTPVSLSHLRIHVHWHCRYKRARSGSTLIGSGGIFVGLSLLDRFAGVHSNKNRSVLRSMFNVNAC